MALDIIDFETSFAVGEPSCGETDSPTANPATPNSYDKGEIGIIQTANANGVLVRAGGTDLGDGYGAWPAARTGANLRRFLTGLADGNSAGAKRTEDSNTVGTDGSYYLGTSYRWFDAWSFYIPEDWHRSGDINWNLIQQYHESTGQPVISMRTYTGGSWDVRHKIATNTFTARNLGTLPLEQWVDLVWDIRPATNNTGVRRLWRWVNNEWDLIDELTDRPTFIDGSSCYFKEGFYHGSIAADMRRFAGWRKRGRTSDLGYDSLTGVNEVAPPALTGSTPGGSGGGGGTLAISTDALKAGRVGTPYSQLLQAGGGAAPYIWSMSAGALPAGLSLDAVTGEITGTPIGVETANFTIAVEDSGP